MLFYALAGAGMGHAVRARVVLEALALRYEVHVFCSGPARDYLASNHWWVHGLRSPRGFGPRGRLLGWVLRLYRLLTLPLACLFALELLVKMVKLRPVALVTDAEPLSTWAALALRPFRRMPILDFATSGMFRFADPPGLGAGEARKLGALRRRAASAVPYADRHLVLSPAQPRLHMGRARYVPHPVREAVLARSARVRRDGPVVIYLGGVEVKGLVAAFEEGGLTAHVYGAREERREGPVEFRRFDEPTFIDDFAAAPFVVLHGGAMVADALALGKPMLLYAVHAPLEEQLTALAVEAQGYGRCTRALTPEALRAFVSELPRLRDAVAAAPPADNPRCFAELVDAIEELRTKER